MDPKVLDHFDGDPSRANLHTRGTARLVRRYGPGGSTITADGPA